MYYLELNPAFLEHSALVHSEPDREFDLVVVEDLVVLDQAFFGAATVLSRCRMREVPFYERGACDERDVVEVYYLEAGYQHPCRSPAAGWRRHTFK